MAYILGIEQVIQIQAFAAPVLGPLVLQTDDNALVLTTAALVLSIGNFVVLYQVQNALFE